LRADGEEKTMNEEYVFEQFRVSRGCLGYLVADPKTRFAAIIDPEEEMADEMMEEVFRRNLRPKYIIDTHTHADHVSAARDLKNKTCAKVVMHEKAPASIVDVRVSDGDRLHLGNLAMKFRHAPGHAKDLVVVVLPGRTLTADALLIGSCGRTDLLNGNATQQYFTLTEILRTMPDDLEVWPGHDYEERTHSTLGEEKRNNPKMHFSSEEEFVEYMDLENPKKLSEVCQLAESLKANME
jgi:glyoxylase-like metal-dependent hydrolase (beta-lactamase superfamily II)